MKKYGGKIAAGYLPEWRSGAYAGTDLSALTHLNIAFPRPDRSGVITTEIPDGDMRSMVSAAHAAGVRVMASLGGFGGCDVYTELISSQEKIEALDRNIMDFCEKYSLDGVDLDMELEREHELWKYYPAWVSHLRELCSGRGYDLSTASAQWLTPGVSAEVFSMFDFINVMAYDNEAGAVSHSDTDFAVKTLDFFEKGFNIPREKLVLGVPFYGRGRGGNTPYDKCIMFSELIALDTENYSRDSYEGTAYNGAGTIAEKTRLAAGYGGVMIWEISQDAKHPYSLLEVIKNTLGSCTGC